MLAQRRGAAEFRPAGLAVFCASAPLRETKYELGTVFRRAARGGPRSVRPAWGLAALALFSLFSLSSSAPAPPPIARDQIFFVGDGPAPTLLALVLQRVPAGDGATVEAKAFLVWDGRFETPFYARRAVDAWPATFEEAAAAVAGDRLRVTAEVEPFRVALRRPSGGLEVSAPALAPAGTGDDPHGEVAWSAGRGTLRVNGRAVHGTVLVERLTRPRTAWPRFGTFEMWLLAPAGGGLVLGRPGASVVVSPEGRAHVAPFEAVADAVHADEPTGFLLPARWRVAGDRLDRVTGAVGRGTAPGGGPAVYDVSYARGDGGAALVFHLTDGP